MTNALRIVFTNSSTSTPVSRICNPLNILWRLKPDSDVEEHLVAFLLSPSGCHRGWRCSLASAFLPITRPLSRPGPICLCLAHKHPCLLLARKCRFGRAFLRPPPAFFSSYLFHCSCIVLPSSSGLGALFCLSHYSFHAIYCLLTWRAFPPPPLSIDSESSASWNPGVIVLRNSFCNKIDLIQTSSVLKSQKINSFRFFG